MKDTARNYYDIEERTFQFSKNVRSFAKRVPRTIENIEDIKQLIRASGSPAATYIEANEALSRKDFILNVYLKRRYDLEHFFI